MLRIEIGPMEDSLMVENPVAEEADAFEIRLAILPMVKAFRKERKHSLDAARQERGIDLIMWLE